MMNSWKQRAKRDGVVLKVVKLDVPMENEEEIVRRYENAITQLLFNIQEILQNRALSNYKFKFLLLNVIKRFTYT